MFDNELTDSNSKWQNLYADDSFASKKYRYNEEGNVVNENGELVGGAVRYHGKKYVFWGKEQIDIYLYRPSFKNPERLYLTIGHELVHVDLHYLGYHDHSKHEATAYKWSSEQAKAWGWTGNVNDYNARVRFYGTPYPYQRSIRSDRPINPFRR